MSASFVASFFIFILTGIYSITTRLDFHKDGIVKGFVVAALVANALYYHYVASYTELDDDVRNALKEKTRFEWVIRITNQCVLLSLWFWLDHGWYSFRIALLVLYGSYLLWDWVTWKSFVAHKLFKYDLIGTLVSFIFVWACSYVMEEKNLGVTSQNNFYMLLGILTVIYLCLPFGGMKELGFKPWAKKYWTRPELH